MTPRERMGCIAVVGLLYILAPIIIRAFGLPLTYGG